MTRNILIVLDKSWAYYYAGSPYHYLSRIQEQGFQVLTISTPTTLEERRAVEDAMATASAIICDEATYAAFPDARCLRLLLIDDIHCWNAEHQERRMAAVKWADLTLSDYIFSRPEAVLRHGIPRSARNRFVFFPHFIVGNQFCWVPVEERLPIIIPGSWRDTFHSTNKGFDASYPLRITCRRTPIFQALAETYSEKSPKKASYRSEFIEFMSDYLIGVTCNLQLEYTIAKYFEIPAAGCLLYASDMTSSLERSLIGYDETNSVLVPRDRIYDVAFHDQRLRELLNAPDLVANLARNGQAVVRQRHCLSHRLRYLRALVAKMTSGNFHIADQFDLFAASWDRTDASAPSRTVSLLPEEPPKVSAAREQQFTPLIDTDARVLEAFWTAVAKRLDAALSNTPALAMLECWLDVDYTRPYAGLSIVDRDRKGRGYRFVLEGYAAGGGYFGVMRPRTGPEVPSEDALRAIAASRQYPGRNEGWVFYSRPNSGVPFRIPAPGTPAFEAELRPAALSDDAALADQVAHATLAEIEIFASAYAEAQTSLD